MDEWDTGLDDLSMAELEALAGSLMNTGKLTEGLVDGRKKKLRLGISGVPKHRPGGDGGGFLWERLPETGLNQTISVTIELPAYLVAGMQKHGGISGTGYREAVSQYLERKGDTWWQPRYLAVLKAKQIEAAIKRFTTGTG